MTTKNGSNGINFVTGALLGCAAMYILDLTTGRSRRAFLGDKARSLVYKARETLEDAGEYANGRASGIVSETKAKLAGVDVSDRILVERVRSQMGRAVSHPGSIDIRARSGEIEVSGPVLEKEVRNLLSCIRKVRGVKNVRSRLDIHDRPAGIPGLQ